jgi:hypothetical protein
MAISIFSVTLAKQHEINNCRLLQVAPVIILANKATKARKWTPAGVHIRRTWLAVVRNFSSTSVQQ